MKRMSILVIVSILISAACLRNTFAAENKLGIGFNSLDLGLFKPTLISFKVPITQKLSLQPTVGYCSLEIKSSSLSIFPGGSSSNSMDLSITGMIYGVNGLYKIIERENSNLYLGAGISNITISNANPIYAYSVLSGMEWFFDKLPDIGFFVNFGYSFIDFKDSSFAGSSTDYTNFSNEYSAGASNMSWGIHYYF